MNEKGDWTRILYIFFKPVKSNFIAIPSFAGRAAVTEVSQSQKALVSSGEVILTPSAPNTESKRWDPLAAISGCDFLIKACQKLMLITGSCLNCCLKVARYTIFAELDFVQRQCSWARNASPSLPDFVLRNHKVALQMLCCKSCLPDKCNGKLIYILVVGCENTLAVSMFN